MHSLIFTFLFTIFVNVDFIQGHGRMLEPPMRSSAWRYGFPTPKNYNDNELNCGGFPNQMANGGKCGPCGDPWQGPRENEAGGKFGTGTVVREYAAGQIINATIEVTSNHKGYFEFRLCPNNNPRRRVTQACLDRYVLNILGYGQRYVITAPDVRVFIELKLSLPPGVTCSQCVLQWKWRAAQNRGSDGKGGECFGCGPQEHFINCADVSIAGGSKKPLPLNRPSGVSQAHVFTSKKSSSAAVGDSYNAALLPQQKSIDISLVPYADPSTANFNEVTYYENAQNALVNNAQPAYSPTLLNSLGYYQETPVEAPVVTTNTQNTFSQYQTPTYKIQQQAQQQTQQTQQQQPSATGHQYQTSGSTSQVDNAILSYTSALTSDASESAFIECPDGYAQPTCKAIAVFSKMTAFNTWCSSMCPTGLCPSGMCTCTCPVKHATQYRATPQPRQPVIQCHGVRIPGWNHPTTEIDQWCQQNCQFDNCPSEFCVCTEY